MNNENLKPRGCPNSGGPPVNMLEIVDEKTLLNLVLETATEVMDKGLVKPSFNIPKWFTPPSLLSLTCYGYLTCKYSSAEISEGIRTDTALRYLSAKMFPDPSIFIKFRRANTEAIIQCVNLVITKIRNLCSCKNKDNVSNQNTDSRNVCDITPDGEKRLGMAVMFDCLERDI